MKVLTKGYGHNQRKRRSINAVHEIGGQQSIQSLLGGIRIVQSPQNLLDVQLDFRITNHTTHMRQGFLGSFLNSLVSISQNLNKAWHNGRQASAKLFRSTESHSSEQLNTSFLSTPCGRLVLEWLEEGWKEGLHTKGCELSHDLLGCSSSCKTNFVRVVTKRGKESWKDLLHVRLESTAQNAAETLVL